MRYFYKVGEFTRHSQRVKKTFKNGICVSAEMQYIVDQKYDDLGWDVRSWKTFNTLKEVNEQVYNEILKLENSIIQKQREIGLERIGHHFPIALSESEIQKFKSAGLEFKELTVQ